MKKLDFIIMAVIGMAVALPRSVAADRSDPQASTSAASDITVTELEAKGDALRRDKDYEGAVQMYRTALRKQPKNSVLVNKLGLSQLQRGDLVAAQDNFQKAVKLNRKFAEAQNNVGVVYYIQGKYDSSINAYKKALALQEGNATFHANLAGAWFATKKMDRAVAEYMRALELDPDVIVRSERGGTSAHIASPEDRAQFHYLLAKLYAKRGDLDRALECLQKAKEEGYGKLADVYSDQEFAMLRQDARLTELIPQPKR